MEGKRHTLKIMGRSGHDTITWDPELEAEVESAFEAFNTARTAGHVAFAVEHDDKTDGRLIRTFDPDADIVMSLPLVGG